MTDRAERIRQILARLVDGKRRLGAAVVGRDGQPIVSKLNRPANEESFGAMTAAIIGAAEAALQEWSDDRPQRVTVEGRAVDILIQGLDADSILAVTAVSGQGLARPEVDGAAIEIGAVLAERANPAPPRLVRVRAR